MGRQGRWRLPQKIWILLLALLALGWVLAERAIATDLAPALKVHPLPSTLVQASIDSTLDQDDYFDQITRSPVGQLVWSNFPVSIYIQPLEHPRDRAWVMAAEQAVQEWAVYLPLKISPDQTQADIAILRQAPPLGRYQPGGPLPKVRFAQTTYTFELKTLIDRRYLQPRMVIKLRPGQPDLSLLAGARHELGHALGLWGHSDRATDVMYAAQVRTPPQISTRDLNTLRRVYREPTRLGWPIPDTMPTDLPSIAPTIQ